MSDGLIQRTFRSHTVRFGSIALALSFITLEVIWCWATQADSSAVPLTTKRVARSQELSMEELYESIEAGRFQLVHEELDKLMQTMPAVGDWNYGNVCHHYLILLGLLALHEDNDLDKAKCSLTLAGQVDSSPQLLSFGPNMLLARELLARGETATVELYLEDCKSLWLAEVNTLDAWLQQIRQQRIPDFGPNLAY